MGVRGCGRTAGVLGIGGDGGRDLPLMTYVVTERCVNCRYTDCAEICPVDCFWKVEEPAMLVIDPIVCIDCSYCVPACPVHAIWLDEEVPAVYRDWIGRNVELLAGAVQWSVKEPAMPGALTLEQ